jgi:hypothetical protein
MHTILGETLGEGLPDSFGAAGNDGDFILMPFAHETSLSMTGPHHGLPDQVRQ